MLSLACVCPGGESLLPHAAEEPDASSRPGTADSDACLSLSSSWGHSHSFYGQGHGAGGANHAAVEAEAVTDSPVREDILMCVLRKGLQLRVGLGNVVTGEGEGERVVVGD
jgi:hypothetical protein